MALESNCDLVPDVNFQIKGKEWERFWDIQGAADYMCARGLTVVTLQFPDDHLREAKDVSKAVQDACASRGMKVTAFVLADTTYNSLGVDEVAAQHVHAQCVIHYGRASLSPLSSLPAYFVFTCAQLDCGSTAERLVAWAVQHSRAAVVGRKAIVVLPDQPLLWAVAELRARLASAAEKANLQVPIVVADVQMRELDPVPSSSPQPNSQLPPAAHPATSQTPVTENHTGADASSSQQQHRQPGMNGSHMTGSTDHSQPLSAPVWRESVCCRDAQLIASLPQPMPRQTWQCAPSHQPCCSAVPEAQPQVVAESTSAQNAAPAEGAAPLRDVSGPRHWAAAGLQCALPEGVEAEDCQWVWLGDDDAPALTQLLMTYSRMQWAMYNPREDSFKEGLPWDISRTLRKRNFLVEKAKNANIVGIVVGTLGVAGYLEAAEQVRKLAQAAGKKTYTLLMGKPSPVKLANFPEVDVFVLIADAQGQILDSKEFYAPLITPYEAQLAFAPEGASVSDDYRLDFNALLSSAPQASSSEQVAPRFSLVDGGRYGAAEDSPGTAASTALAERSLYALHLPKGAGRVAEVKSAAEYLVARRTYRGLETPYTGAEARPVVKAVAGRSGRAAQYEDEPAA